jgi:hypothetical protein
LVVGLTLPMRSEAAKLGEFLTRKDLSRPLLLDQNGKQLQLSSPSHPHPSATQGSTPTYLALPLYGGEHLPVAVAAIDAGAQAGSTGIGPLDLSTLVKAQLNGALDSSGLALVDTAKQNYLVEYLPHFARSHQGSNAGSGTTAAAGSTSSSATGQQTTSNSNSSLSKLLTANQWNNWANSGLADLKKLLNINRSNSKSSPSKPSVIIQAQILGPNDQGSGLGSPLPPPVPEPSGWIVFTLLLGASGLAYRVRRGRQHTAV